MRGREDENGKKEKKNEKERRGEWKVEKRRMESREDENGKERRGEWEGEKSRMGSWIGQMDQLISSRRFSISDARVRMNL